MDFAKALLEQANVAVVPGLPFGCDKNVRLSFATSMANITEGLESAGKLAGRVTTKAQRHRRGMR